MEEENDGIYECARVGSVWREKISLRQLIEYVTSNVSLVHTKIYKDMTPTLTVNALIEEKMKVKNRERTDPQHRPVTSTQH